MPRRTRSIVLVLIGTGVTAGCDDRRRHPPSDPAEPDGSYAEAPTTQATSPANGGQYPSSPPSGQAYHASHPGTGWTGGSMFDARRGYGRSTGGGWAAGYLAGRASAGSSPSSGHGSGSTSSAAGEGHGTSFGGFGSHASAAHAGS